MDFAEGIWREVGLRSGRGPRGSLQSQGQPGEQAEGQSPGRGCLQLGTAQRSSGGGN